MLSRSRWWLAQGQRLASNLRLAIGSGVIDDGDPWYGTNAHW
jgi:hypothetical protein